MSLNYINNDPVLKGDNKTTKDWRNVKKERKKGDWHNEDLTTEKHDDMTLSKEKTHRWCLKEKPIDPY